MTQLSNTQSETARNSEGTAFRAIDKSGKTGAELASYLNMSEAHLNKFKNSTEGATHLRMACEFLALIGLKTCAVDAVVCPEDSVCIPKRDCYFAFINGRFDKHTRDYYEKALAEKGVFKVDSDGSYIVPKSVATAC